MTVRSSSALNIIQPWCGFDAVARAVSSTVVWRVDLSGGAQRRVLFIAGVRQVRLFQHFLLIAC